MNYPRYLSGFTKITVFLSLILCAIFAGTKGIDAAFFALIATPIVALFTWFFIAVAVEIIKWIWKDFKKLEEQ